MPDKAMLTPAVMESQAALELPDRDMLSLVTIVALNGVITHINVTNNDVAAQICAQALASGSAQNCLVTQ